MSEPDNTPAALPPTFDSSTWTAPVVVRLGSGRDAAGGLYWDRYEGELIVTEDGRFDTGMIQLQSSG